MPQLPRQSALNEMNAKNYWDSSAVLKAMQDPAVHKRLKESHAVTRVHTLAECFSTLTGSRLGYRHKPEDAAHLVAEFAKDFEFVELTAAETLAGLKKAQGLGVMGGRIHDLLHARAAQKAGCASLVTINTTDFTGLEDGFKLATT